jgi:hypothetical protein
MKCPGLFVDDFFDLTAAPVHDQLSHRCAGGDLEVVPRLDRMQERHRCALPLSVEGIELMQGEALGISAIEVPRRLIAPLVARFQKA